MHRGTKMHVVTVFCFVFKQIIFKCTIGRSKYTKYRYLREGEEGHFKIKRFTIDHPNILGKRFKIFQYTKIRTNFKAII